MDNTNNIDIKVLYSIISFQRHFRVKLESIKNLNKKMIFYNEIMISLSTNLTTCNNNKIFSNSVETYKKILKELETIKNEISKITLPITIESSSKEGGIAKISLNVIYIEGLIRKIMNKMSPENMNIALKFLINEDWVYQIDAEILEELLFYIKMFIPINVQKINKDSKNEIKLIKNENDSSESGSSSDEKDKKKDKENSKTDISSLISDPFSISSASPLIFINGNKSDNSLTKSITDLLKDRKKTKKKSGNRLFRKLSKLTYEKCLKTLATKI